MSQLFTNNHVITIRDTTVTEKQVIDIISAVVKSLKLPCSVKINMVHTKSSVDKTTGKYRSFGTPNGFCGIFFSNPEVFHAIFNENPNGTPRVKRIQKEIKPLTNEEINRKIVNWADECEEDEFEEIPLPPLVTIPSYHLTGEQVRRFRERYPDNTSVPSENFLPISKSEFTDSEYAANLKLNTIISSWVCIIPEWLTTEDIRKAFQIYEVGNPKEFPIVTITRGVPKRIRVEFSNIESGVMAQFMNRKFNYVNPKVESDDVYGIIFEHEKHREQV